MDEGFSFIARRRFDRRQALAIFRHAHHHIAQKGRLRRRRTQIRACRRRLHRGQLTAVLLAATPTDRALICATADFKVAASPRFAAIRLSSSNAARLSGCAARIFCNSCCKSAAPLCIALPFGFFRQSVKRPQILRIQFHRFAQIGNGLRGMAALALQNSQQVVDAIILRSQIARPFKSLRRSVVVSLAQRQYSPICPTRRLTGYKLSYFRKLAVGVDVVAHLQRRQPDIEGRDDIRVLFRTLIGQFRRGGAA